MVFFFIVFFGWGGGCCCLFPVSSSLQTFRSLQESELVELRETIEMLKTQNTDAQTAIQVALNGPDHLHKGNAGSCMGCWNTLEAFGVWRRLLNPLLYLNYWMHIYPDWPQESSRPLFLCGKRYLMKSTLKQFIL